MQSPATMPGTIRPTPDTTPYATSPRPSTYNNTSAEQAIPMPTPVVLAPPSDTATTTPLNRAATRAFIPTAAKAPLPETFQPLTTSLAPAPGVPTGPSPRNTRWHLSKWITCAVANRERGMSTAEYAVGTIAACAFAALLFKVVSSPEVQEMLKSLIDRALKTTG
ncbi:hypothetical protein GCM10010176_021610 [Nonomuraea spiralis]|nr:DUF4244 domain-containing protein [Nonomuraea spiralis]GGS78199.1 hypothetical protein GCM10010176_021610 [Nonomuraea spiralis]